MGSKGGSWVGEWVGVMVAWRGTTKGLGREGRGVRGGRPRGVKGFQRRRARLSGKPEVDTAADKSGPPSPQSRSELGTKGWDA
jgi:hypothetical protein